MRAAILFVLTAVAGFGQTSPFLPEDLHQKLVNEISGEIAHEHMRWFSHYHRPMGGSEGFEAVAKYVGDKARESRLQNVRYIRLPSEAASWTAKQGELWLVEPERRRLAFFPEIAISLADHSRTTAGENVELIDVGEGTRESDYTDKSVEGKVVLAHGSLATVTDEAVWKRGARGILYFTLARPHLPDQIPWVRVPVENKEKTKQGTFAFVISQREGLRMRRALANAGKPFRVSYRIESSFLDTPSQAIVEAMIQGSEIHDQDIVLTAHLQEELFSANDDASGCANVLEIGRALQAMIDRGELPRPRRDIRFWWVDEISAPEEYFAQKPDERRQFLANINQDMVGARLSFGDRVQFVTRPPWSRSHFLGDVTESIVEALVRGNTSYLAAGQARQLARGDTGTSAVTHEDIPFSRPVLSRIGTREPYDARVIPFHNNTDHQVFNMGVIGIPGVTFTNWPDDFIHSTDDDLWQMDRTQLKRNAVAVAAIAWYLANAGPSDVPQLASEVSLRGAGRIARDQLTALQMLNAGGDFSRASGLVREAAEREARALRSIERIGKVAITAPTADQESARLATLYRQVSGRTIQPPGPSKQEQELARKVPSVTGSVKDYVAKRRLIVKPKSLHALMAYEALNFVDGTRSYLDIYRAVAAEADSAGDWYYGRVTLEDVAAYLDSAVDLGVLQIK